MGAGVRVRVSDVSLRAIGLRLEDLAGRLWIVRDRSRPYSEPFPECVECGHHECKTYHLQLDEQSTAIVSHGVWDRLRCLFDNGGLEAVNDVVDPPAQTILLPTVTSGVTSVLNVKES